jgi:uncharacterized protein YbjQ (UPF0145 family)
VGQFEFWLFVSRSRKFKLTHYRRDTFLDPNGEKCYAPAGDGEGETVPEVESAQIGTERRRSERLQLSLPLIVHGIDLLGQPFEERSSTAVLNLHGCRYSSKHHLPKNTWVTLKVARGNEHRSMRARVAWIQRPHSVRELFQIAVELESPANVWGLDPAPADWAASGVSLKPPEASPIPRAPQTERPAETSEAEAVPTTLAQFLEDLSSGAASPFAGSTERASQKPLMPPEDLAAATEGAAAGWRERLEREMEIAQAQWNELLQSSLDGSIQRLAERLSERSQEALSNAGETISAQLAALREPLAQSSAEARDALAAVKRELEQEIGSARSALAEIEQLAGRMKEYSAQFEAANQDTLNELHRRAEAIAAEAPERLASSLDSLGHQVSERTVADVESKVAPHLARVSELLGEMAAREAQADEALRLHRERLRQIVESNRREADAQMAAALARFRGDFETAREEALLKCNEELESGVARASHAAVESISRSSEWLQEEARARLQVQVEQTLAAAGAGLAEKTGEAEGKFAAQLEENSSARLAEIRRELDGLAGELAGRTRTQIDKAAEDAAATFGEVLSGISEREVRQFTDASRSAVEERTEELERFSREFLRGLEEQGQATVESLVGATGRALRESCAMIFGALAKSLGEPAASPAGVVAFAPAPGREPSEPPPPRKESAPDQLSA